MRLATTHTYQTPTVRERVRCGHRVHVGPCASCQLGGLRPAGRAHSRRRAQRGRVEGESPQQPPTEGGRPTPTAGGRRGGEGGCLGAVPTDGYAGGGSGCGCPRVLRPGDLVLVGEQHVGQQHALKGVVAKVAMPVESVSEVVAVLRSRARSAMVTVRATAVRSRWMRRAARRPARSASIMIVTSRSSNPRARALSHA